MTTSGTTRPASTCEPQARSHNRSASAAEVERGRLGVEPLEEAEDVDATAFGVFDERLDRGSVVCKRLEESTTERERGCGLTCGKRAVNRPEVGCLDIDGRRVGGRC